MDNQKWLERYEWEDMTTIGRTYYLPAEAEDYRIYQRDLNGEWKLLSDEDFQRLDYEDRDDFDLLQDDFHESSAHLEEFEGKLYAVVERSGFRLMQRAYLEIPKN